MLKYFTAYFVFCGILNSIAFYGTGDNPASVNKDNTPPEVKKD